MLLFVPLFTGQALPDEWNSILLSFLLVAIAVLVAAYPRLRWVAMARFSRAKLILD
jgi:hypothetical protein